MKRLAVAVLAFGFGVAAGWAGWSKPRSDPPRELSVVFLGDPPPGLPPRVDLDVYRDAGRPDGRPGSPGLVWRFVGVGADGRPVEFYAR